MIITYQLEDKVKILQSIAEDHEKCQKEQRNAEKLKNTGK